MTADSPAPPVSSRPARRGHGPYGVAAVVMIGSFMAVLDGTIINVAIPALQGWFARPDGALPAYSTVAWTVTGYALATAAINLTDRKSVV